MREVIRNSYSCDVDEYSIFELHTSIDEDSVTLNISLLLEESGRNGNTYKESEMVLSKSDALNMARQIIDKLGE